MKIHTFSIVVGTPACDAACPHCISRQTGLVGIDKSEINFPNLRKACQFAEKGGTSTVLFTGKGEPTLFPKEIYAYLAFLSNFSFPFIELQTNGFQLGQLANGENSTLTHKMLSNWKFEGLNTIAISTYSPTDPKVNERMFQHAPMTSLPVTIKMLRDFGFTVRLCVMLVKGGVDTVAKLKDVVRFCGENDVAQLTIRPIRYFGGGPNVLNFVSENALPVQDLARLGTWVAQNGAFQYSVAHGAEVYTLNAEEGLTKGQNVCVSDCMTLSAKGTEEIRTLIFYRNGQLDTDWRPGSTILSGR